MKCAVFLLEVSGFLFFALHFAACVSIEEKFIVIRQMSEIISHHDPSRRFVSATAYYAANMRALEHESSRRLFEDPYAKILAGEVGATWYAMKNAEDSEYARYLQAVFTFRTTEIDQTVRRCIDEGIVKQICVLGAGLDARPWRLAGNKSISYFEVDFPEIFNYKLPLIQTIKSDSDFNYHSVSADLSLPDWPDYLNMAGFDSSVPTLWLVEGLSMYLTEPEITKFLQTITLLSESGSVLMADFISSEGLNVVGTSSFAHMFRFTPDNALEFLQQFGWSSCVGKSITDVATELGHIDMIPTSYQSRLNRYMVCVNSL